ncbi:hypothetical protein ACIA5G_49400 [Amycolatopsis sp. NPDC051758]|uniref:hypothetical protein n=1 Tax=Amycolatopsis sp. NPDC051758 TaxID=3363935 RepID=UPI0037A04E7B
MVVGGGETCHAFLAAGLVDLLNFHDGKVPAGSPPNNLAATSAPPVTRWPHPARSTSSGNPTEIPSRGLARHHVAVREWQ